MTLAVFNLFSVSAADPYYIGLIGNRGLPEAFAGKEAVITRHFKEAYQWAQTLHAHKSTDGKFDFGNSSVELVHGWTAWVEGGQERSIVCQDFSGGNSCAMGALAFNNWAALLCTDPETCQVIVMRDAPAEWYAKGGGVNNMLSGNPVTNQYWRMEDNIPVLYQQFENGYLRIEEGDNWYAEFISPLLDEASYKSPPAAPPAYGSIYKPNQDGCTWENPKYIPAIPIGDMDWSGKINISDVMELCKILARQSAGNRPTANEMELGDLNQSGTITIDDVMELCKLLACQA